MKNIIITFILLIELTNCKTINSQNNRPEKCRILKSMNFNAYYGKPIEVLLSDERLKGYWVGKMPYLTEPSLCLSSIRVGIEEGVYLYIYPTDKLKYNKRCKEDHNWDFESLKKEELVLVEVKCY